jgi:hypothetical protein
MVGVVVTYHVEEMEAFAATIVRAPALFQKELQPTLDKSAKIVQKAAKENLTRTGAVASRGLIDSVDIGVLPNGAGRTVGTAHPAGGVIERGRKVGAKMPPKGSLLRWMSIKGIEPKAEFAIRRAIQRRGQAARPWLHPALLTSRAAINREFVLMTARVVRQINNMPPTPRAGVTAR